MKTKDNPIRIPVDVRTLRTMPDKIMLVFPDHSTRIIKVQRFVEMLVQGGVVSA